LATVRPPAPSASCRSPSSGDLCVFVCGQRATPFASAYVCRRSRLASTRSRSTTAAGVSISATGRPTCASSSRMVRSDAVDTSTVIAAEHSGARVRPIWRSRKEHLLGQRPPLPPFDEETARQKVQAAEDAWNTRDPDRVALAYTEDSQWRNR